MPRPRSRSELLASGVPHPDLIAEIKKNPLDPGPPPDRTGSLESAFIARREHRANILVKKEHLRYLPGPIPEVHERDEMITVRDGAQIRVRIYTPVEKKADQATPLIVMYHEGGFCMGALVDEEVNCRLFSRDLHAVCVNVEYRLAPEHKFPVWIHDSWDALQWAAANASHLGADPTAGFLIGGGSAGSNITAVLAHLARDQPLNPPLTGQYLCVPSTMLWMSPDEVPEKYRAEYLSHPDVTKIQDPILARPNLEAAQKILGFDEWNPLMAPFLYGSMEGGHREVAPAYLQVCGLDPLRDEGLLYEKILREEADVPTKLDFYPGLGHYFWTNFPELQQSRDFVRDTVEGMRWLLERK